MVTKSFKTKLKGKKLETGDKRTEAIIVDLKKIDRKVEIMIAYLIAF